MRKRNPEPVTKRQLRGLIKDCLNKDKNADSDANVIAAQRHALESLDDGNSKSVHEQFEEAQSFLNESAKDAAQ
ncbi:hypothetical protein AB7B51_17495 [Acinetobacter baumannii]|uniref:hypothetical protein n=1 Tax=Acinetobacter baumannii TaxID=470 RepID=UPI0034E29DF7